MGDKIFICQNHPWMKKASIKESYIEEMMDDLFICGYHPWMKSTDKDDG